MTNNLSKSELGKELLADKRFLTFMRHECASEVGIPIMPFHNDWAVMFIAYKAFRPRSAKKLFDAFLVTASLLGAEVSSFSTDPSPPGHYWNRYLARLQATWQATSNDDA